LAMTTAAMPVALSGWSLVSGRSQPDD
jgi:hypothetical protein